MGPEATSVDTRLAVQCSPRGEEQLKEVSFTGDPVSVTFEVTAYPAPYEVSFAYVGQCECQTGTARAVRGITLEGRCEAQAGAVYRSTCTVTVSSVTTEEAAGLYRVIITNTAGSATFRLKVEGDVSPQAQSGDSGSGSASMVWLAAALGVLLAVLLLANIAVLVWLWRRQWSLPCTHEKETDPEHARRPAIRNTTSGEQLSQESNLEPSASDRGTYQSLQMSDVGRMSTYSVINHRGNQSSQSTEANTAKGTGSLYENLPAQQTST